MTKLIPFFCGLLVVQSAFALTCQDLFRRNEVVYELSQLIQEAKLKEASRSEDTELADLLRRAANQNLDLNNLSEQQREAFRLAHALSPKVVWTNKLWFANAPQRVEIGAFPQRGLQKVTAQVSFHDLIKDGKTVERVIAVSFVAEIDGTDARARALPPRVKSIWMDRNSFNSKAKWRRRAEALNYHEAYNTPLINNPQLRLVYVAQGLQAVQRNNQLVYLMPHTEVSSLKIIFMKDLWESTEVQMSLRQLFEEAITRRRETTVINGYQNGNTRNRSTSTN